MDEPITNPSRASNSQRLSSGGRTTSGSSSEDSIRSLPPLGSLPPFGSPVKFGSPPPFGSHHSFGSLQSFGSPPGISVGALGSDTSAIMDSVSLQHIDSYETYNPGFKVERNTLDENFQQISLKAIHDENFHFLDKDEKLLVKSNEEFLKYLGCPGDTNLKIKVVSIFGNTGEGKSHLLNEVFFKGQKVFKTSNTQNSCTVGVWGAYCKEFDVLVLDTEGLLGVSANSHKRKRLLLKVLAISDVIIYRTRSERLHTDMFTFLSEASVAYTKHFKSDLDKIKEKEKCDFLLGPSVYIVQDTRNTDVLTKDRGVFPVEQIRDMFTRQNLSINGFSSISYIGERTEMHDMNFESVRSELSIALLSSKIRAPRKPSVILSMLKTLNDRFNDKIIQKERIFPDEYFTCTSVCKACESRCSLYMNHMEHDQLRHESSNKCCFKKFLDNKIYLCAVCHKNGKRSITTYSNISSNESAWVSFAKLAWSGYIIDCKTCGIIYRSREYWYGNEEPNKTCVVEENAHVWPGCGAGNSPNTGRQLLESVASIKDIVSSISPSTTFVSNWLSDQVAPSYWKPNDECINCDLCKSALNGVIHHCRKCGQGFCDVCSTKRQTVEGWGTSPVRVCNPCFEAGPLASVVSEKDRDNSVRHVAERIQETISSVTKVPIDLIKDSTRPTYWKPDEEITECCICNKTFLEGAKVHHCRSCGEGVCEDCSFHRIPVPDRGWENKVRVCDLCFKVQTQIK